MSGNAVRWAASNRSRIMTTAEYGTVDPETERLEAFHDLLPALARTLDVRDIFHYLSQVASRILPHDEANLGLLTEDGSQFHLYASTRSGGPDVVCRDHDSAGRGYSYGRFQSRPDADR